MIDWVAGVFELAGSWLVGNKNKFGFILTMIGCVLWVYVAIHTGVYGLLVVVVPALFVNMRNFFKWHHSTEAGATPYKIFSLRARREPSDRTGGTEIRDNNKNRDS